MLIHEQLSQARILIVDDQRLHGLFLKNLLSQEGYLEVLYLQDPLKTQATVRELHPDLIILDLIMPQLNGFQILEQLQELRQQHYLPIIALAEDKSAEMRINALQSGATDFLHKPYENIEILYRIRHLIEMRLLHLTVENQNKILEVKVKDRTKELLESQLDVIHRLAQAAEFRDNDTGIHIIRMSHYCTKFAEAMGLEDDECELMLSASPLHDVGKIGIPDQILLKPGPLTQEEFEIMKTHTTMGAQLLSGSHSPVMKMARQIALTHHEKWDGSGYPQQLKGTEIPLIGQIVSICDVFDALCSDRPYKKAWGVDEALKEIKKQKQKHFQAALVERFEQVMPEIIAIKNQYTEEKSAGA